MAKKANLKTKVATKKVATKKVTANKDQKVKKAVSKTASSKTKSSSKTAVKKNVETKSVAKKSDISKTIKKGTTKLKGKTKTGKKIEVVVAPPKVKPKKIVGYSKKELAEFKAVILEKRTEIIDQLQNLKEQMMDESTGQYVNENSPYSLHMAEQGTDAQEREKLYLWAQRETKFLGYLEDALQRIDNGTYGVCIDSLELPEGPHLIPKNRLLAVPHTQHCVNCKNKK
jgi:DnaK suppressor protein